MRIVFNRLAGVALVVLATGSLLAELAKPKLDNDQNDPAPGRATRNPDREESDPGCQGPNGREGPGPSIDGRSLPTPINPGERLRGSVEAAKPPISDEAHELTFASPEQARASEPNWLPIFESFLPKIEDIQPQPPAAIPSDPPPREGAMIDIPITLQPADLIIIEVLAALPGRPITGQRLVRPDGTITLGFYGDVHVRNLTLVQAKTKIILHLRKYLSDEVLGLAGVDSDGRPIYIPPADSDRILVDIAAYNNTGYFVQGDVASPGRISSTGHDTVLDAWNFAGGSTPTANPKDIKLVRPARGDQPARVYPIDLDAILERGDPKANLQLFPGDRLIVGRDPVVAATIQMDRVVALINQAAAMVIQLSKMARDLNAFFQETEVSPERRCEIVHQALDLLIEAAQREEGEPFDEAAIRALFEKLLDLPDDEPDPEQP